jgi:Flp pilus assembly protein TadG
VKARHRERGSSLPETAIVMAVVLAMLFGIIDFGRCLYTYSFTAQLARQGARWMIVRGSQSCSSSTPIDNCDATAAELQTYVRGLNEGATDPSKITVTPNFTTCAAGAANGGENGPGCVVTVTVSYPFTFIAPFVSKASIPMTSTSQMVISQ